jgi:hypothetical protein
MGGFSFDVLRESDVSSPLVLADFFVLTPRFLVVLTAIFGPILAQILRFFLQLYEHVQHSNISRRIKIVLASATGCQVGLIEIKQCPKSHTMSPYLSEGIVVRG